MEYMHLLDTASEVPVMQIFVPLEEIPEGVVPPGRLVPYQVGMRCLAGAGSRRVDARTGPAVPERPRQEWFQASRELACCED